MLKQDEQAEFWEAAFVEKQEMWGREPANSAIKANDLFLQKSLKNILIPGFGYGRNAKIFRDNGMTVTGIEISSTAIAMARREYGANLKIFHGSVINMPFGNEKYDGIFCHGLIHLFDGDERKKLINDCYNQLAAGGCMVFTAISKKAGTYGQGTCLGPDRYELIPGAKIYFYDRDSAAAEFASVGLFQVSEIEENFPFLFIECHKDKVV